MNKVKHLVVLALVDMEKIGINLKYLVLVSCLVHSPALGQAGQAERRSPTVNAVAKVMPSVVNIATKTRVQRVGYLYNWWRDNWTPYAQQLPPQESAGSGVIVSESGHVLTNVHVVRDADEIWVKLTDENGEQKVYQAEAIAGSLTTDIALLKIIPSKKGETFAAATFAANDDLLLGESVMALGNPFGLGGSVSQGILSSKSRRTETDGKRLEIPDWLQTDASINPGNSGGPLINLSGEMIGINVAVLKEGQGIGFAIPIKRVNESLSRFFTPEFLDDNWFGAKIDASSRPPKVASVETGSPADKGGLKTGDNLLGVNDQATDTFIDFANLLVGLGKNRTVKLQISRNGEKLNRAIKLIPENAVFNSGLIRQKTGATLERLTPEVAEALRFNSTDGFVISQVDRDSPAGKAKLQPGLVVTAIDGQQFDDIIDAAKLVHKKKTGDELTFNVVQMRQRGFFVRRSEGQLTLRVL
jgi:serine protease Do